MMKFTAKFYDEKSGKLLEQVHVNGEPIRKGERIPNVADVALAVVTKVEPARPARSGQRGSLVQKAWVRGLAVDPVNERLLPVPARE